jgi:hypothetical protein
LLEKFGLIHCVIAFVKDENSNLASMAITLHSIVDCELLNLPHAYEGTCFGHVLSKACQYSRMMTKVLWG